MAINQTQCSARQPVRRLSDDGAKIGREGEERSGNRLRGAITGKEASSLTQPGVANASRSNGSTT